MLGYPQGVRPYLTPSLLELASFVSAGPPCLSQWRKKIRIVRYTHILNLCVVFQNILT